jgi:exopolyphosphatase / guanosine-5'-triphosphate,3'-diphosphate pyrophosphatase
MRIAAIDIGTNTCLLLIVDIDDSGILHIVDHQQRFPRIGRQVNRSNVIQQNAFNEVSAILSDYRTIAQTSHADRIIACATSAVRDANNKDDFLSFVQNSTGIMVELLSGPEEATLSYIGAISGLEDQSKPSVVLDIGGGSTEFSFSIKGNIHSQSLQIGAVRITEKYFSAQPPKRDEILHATECIDRILRSIDSHRFKDTMLIGVAGTVTTLACLVQDLKTFRLEKISGYILSLFHVETWLDRLTRMNTDDILQLSDATSGRADILTGGVLILSLFMRRFGFSEITVSERGLRYGLAFREWKRYRPDHLL